ncbi:phage head-tail connector protein [Lysinibacillus sphaericus]|uniref:phage head-tail connector protein n=1 Tax=Lysinibacillus sphaericus TaxID=1421 RepID=UPI00381226F0
MNLNDLKVLLKMPLTESEEDAYLRLKLDEAIGWVQGTCNQSFIVNGVLELPAVAKGVVAQYVAFELQGNTGIKSESMAGMSQSFDSADERNNTLIKKLSTAGLRKLRFKPFGGY